MITLKIFVSLFCVWLVSVGYMMSYGYVDAIPVVVERVVRFLGILSGLSFLLWVFNIVWFT